MDWYYKIASTGFQFGGRKRYSLPLKPSFYIHAPKYSAYVHPPHNILKTCHAQCTCICTVHTCKYIHVHVHVYQGFIFSHVFLLWQVYVGMKRKVEQLSWLEKYLPTSISGKIANGWICCLSVKIRTNDVQYCHRQSWNYPRQAGYIVMSNMHTLS